MKFKKYLNFIIGITFVAFTPFVASAQVSQGLSGILTRISDLLGEIVPVLVGLGVIYFTWGVFQYFIADSEEAKTKGKDKVIYGIIGLALIISVWGLVAILNQTLGIGSSTGLVGVGAPKVDNLAPTPGGGAGSGVCPTLGRTSKLQDLIGYVVCFINDSAIPLIFSIAVVMFIWGAVQFLIIGAGEEEKRAQGKQFMMWGIIALAVMLSVWSLVGILRTTFGFGTSSVLPQVKP